MAQGVKTLHRLPNIYLNYLDLLILIAAIEKWQANQAIKPVGLHKKLKRLLVEESKRKEP
jgi:hypothetical protein